MGSTTSDQELLKQYEAICNEVATRFRGTGDNERNVALRTAQKTLRRLETPHQFKMRQSWAPAELAVATLAIEMDIFKALAASEGPHSVSQIAKQAKGGDELLVNRIVRHLAAHGMVDQVGKDAYVPNDVTRDYTVPSTIGCEYTMLYSMRALASMPYHFRDIGYKNCTDPKNTVWQHAYDKRDFWTWLKDEPEMAKYFNDFMATPRSVESDDIVKIYPFEKLFEGSKPEDVLFVDVGGGFGHMCTNIRKYFPPSRGRVVLQDLPMVVEGKKLDDVEVMSHDFLTEQPIKGAKSYYMRGVCHDHPDSNCRIFLGQIAKVMSKDSRLLVHDTLIDDLHPEQYDTRADFVMMSLFGGMERSQQQMKSLLESVGLRVTGIYKPGPEQWTITEAML